MYGAAGDTKLYIQAKDKEYSPRADVARNLAGKFGTRALEILELLNENPSWNRRITTGLPAIEVEIVFCIRYEMAETIEDLLARRTGSQFYGWKAAIEAAPRAAELLAQEKHREASPTAAALSE